MCADQILTLTIEGPLARVRLSRPRNLNAISRAMLQELTGLAATIDAQDEVRVVIFEGQGRAFSVGFDLQDMAGLLQQGWPPPPEDLRAMAQLGEQMIQSIRGMRAVTIGSAHGYAIGGGLLLLAACDLRVVSEDIVFSVPEIDMGLPLTWGGVKLLTDELGRSRARELILSGRRFGPQALESTGFLHHCVPAAAREDQTLALARDLIDKPGPALVLTKEQLRRDSGLPGRTDAEIFVEAIGDPGFLPGVMRYMSQVRSRSGSD